ncbi:hypothetical protein BRD13_05965 [Halobacteriales archaeon SW_5_70_135]|nr:MAG: hypothetical protein BRD13_05965 [Halobacteriales archaeon SW_5_70_135]
MRERAGLDPEQYESRVVDAGVEAAILDTTGECDTVRAGLSEKSDASRVLFGSITERIGRESTGNVGSSAARSRSTPWGARRGRRSRATAVPTPRRPPPGGDRNGTTLIARGERPVWTTSAAGRSTTW